MATDWNRPMRDHVYASMMATRNSATGLRFPVQLKDERGEVELATAVNKLRDATGREIIVLNDGRRFYSPASGLYLTEQLPEETPE